MSQHNTNDWLLNNIFQTKSAYSSSPSPTTPSSGRSFPVQCSQNPMPMPPYLPYPQNPMPYYPQPTYGPQMNQDHYNHMTYFTQQYFNNMNIENSSQPTKDMPPNSPPPTSPPSPTQESQTESSPIGKEKGKGTGKTQRAKKTDVVHKRWEPDEEKLLAETYVQISEDPRLGIDRNSKSFWKQVTNEYNRFAEYKRTKDMMTGKWTTLQGACNKFAGVVEENERLSGENDSKHLNRCYTIFKQLWGYAFTHHEAWEVLKDHSKWRGVKTVKPGRRVRGLDDIEEPNELFRDDAIPRPPGKPRPSKSAKSDSTRSAASSSSREAFKEMIQEELRVEQEKKIDYIATQKKLEELKFLSFSTEGMTPEDAAGVEAIKADIRRRYFGTAASSVGPSTTTSND